MAVKTISFTDIEFELLVDILRDAVLSRHDMTRDIGPDDVAPELRAEVRLMEALLRKVELSGRH